MFDKKKIDASQRKLSVKICIHYVNEKIKNETQ